MFRVFVNVYQCDSRYVTFFDFRQRSDAVAFYNVVNNAVCEYMRCYIKEVREYGKK